MNGWIDEIKNPFDEPKRRQNLVNEQSGPFRDAVASSLKTKLDEINQICPGHGPSFSQEEDLVTIGKTSFPSLCMTVTFRVKGIQVERTWKDWIESPDRPEPSDYLDYRLGSDDCLQVKIDKETYINNAERVAHYILIPVVTSILTSSTDSGSDVDMPRKRLKEMLDEMGSEVTKPEIGRTERTNSHLKLVGKQTKKRPLKRR